MQKHRKRLSVLLIVVGLLSILIGTVIALSSFTNYEYEQHRFLRLGYYFIFGGLGFLVVWFLFLRLPEMLHDRKSEVARRRKEFFRSHQRPAPRPAAEKQNGSILILVLVLLGLVSALALQVIVSARSARSEADASLTMSLLKLAAIDTARVAMQKLADDPDLDVDHPGEAWAETGEIKDPTGITRMTRIHDAQQLFDLNNISVEMTGERQPPREILASIMTLCRQYTPGQKIDALRDWTDANDAGSWESTLYLSRKDSARIANRILFGIDELLQVDGWDASMFERKSDLSRKLLMDADLVDQITILPVSRDRVIPMNINSASPVALLGVLGIGRDSIVERIVVERKDRPFRGTGFLIDLLGRNDYQQIAPYLDVKSRYFHIQTTAYRDGKSARLYLLAARSDDGTVDAVQAFF